MNLPARIFRVSQASLPHRYRGPHRTTAEGAGAAPSPRCAATPLAQRELLRQYYLAPSAAEQLQLVAASAEHLDFETGLQCLCHTAEACSKGQLEGTAAEQGALARALVRALESSIPELEPPHLGAVLWSLACVDAARGGWSEVLLSDVAAREVARRRVPQYHTRELANLLHAAGRLCGRPPSRAVEDYAAALVGELERRIAQRPYVRGSLAVADCTDLAAACAAIYAGAGAGAPPAAAVRLLEAVAAQVRHQLANKSNLRSPLTPRDLVPRELVRLLNAYADLGHRTEASAAMLDAVAGFVVSRVRSSHLNAVARPADLAAVLAAFAALEHRSVATPELLGAVGEQLRRNAAAQQERRLAGAAGAGAPDDRCPLPEALRILGCHCRLGFRPDDLTMHALVPGLVRELPRSRPADAARLLALLAELGYSPGKKALGLMLARVEDGGMGVGGTGGGGGRAAEAEQRGLAEAAAQHAAELGYTGG